MKFIDSLCETLIRALGLSALASWDNGASVSQPSGPHGVLKPVQNQQAFQARPTAPPSLHTLFPSKPKKASKNGFQVYGQSEKEASLRAQKLDAGSVEDANLPPGPVFHPPNASPKFLCDYSRMRGWRHTGGVGQRNQWLEKPIMDSDNTGGIYNIFTNYDQYAPLGITRKYHLNVTDHDINADGIRRPDGGKTFNEQYPGPWIEACWGDEVEVTVSNYLKYNGTAIHWHGVRMLNAFQHDGVNAITQCAIAPGDSYTYKFNVTQYGTSWYHSHYSLQYADGLAGPITFHGPASADFDVALDPFLFGDWSHNSAFQDFSVELRNPPAKMQTVILNGKGFYNCTNNPNPDCQTEKVDPPDLFEQVFEKGRKYMLRLINTSTASTFIFSIDKHMLLIIEADFVPIEPYYRDSILVGIGQRYHVIVEATPSNNLVPVEDQNYWIRITGADGCFDIEENQSSDTLGIIRYNAGSTANPTTKRYGFDMTCRDEPYESLVPVVPNHVGPPVNNIDQNTGDNFEIGLEWADENYTVPHGNFTRWSMTDTPMWLNFTDPLIDHLGDYSFNSSEYALVPEDYTRDDWVYIIMGAQGTQDEIAGGKQVFMPIAHPMHLHGHDFVLLAQEDRPFHKDDVTNGTFKYDNPPRRDVALLPRHGYMAIGFRTDNPGMWILHCHIAWHASSGLGINIRENEHMIELPQEAIDEKDRVCKNWRTWFANAADHWYNDGEFQEDSGV